MSFDLETLYSLLPAVYRIHDLEQSEHNLLPSDSGQSKDTLRLPLRTLLKVLAEQIGILEENLAQLYDDQFIETCAEWVIPYIGDLVGYHTPQYTSSLSLRGEVANTVSYRRRKGTATLLEQLIRDVTNWHAHIVEYFQLIAATQHVNRARAENCLVDLCRRDELEELGTPFEHIVHTADVRNSAALRGGYNIPNIGIFLWRLNAYSLTNVPAVRAFKNDNYRYLLSSLGNNMQLFHYPQSLDDTTPNAGPLNVAMPINRSILTRLLSDYYGVGKSLLLTVDNKNILPDPKQKEQKLTDLLTVSNLSDMRDADGNMMVDNYGNAIWASKPEDKIAIDPVLGRIAFPSNKPAPALGTVYSTFHYGFSADIGGGEYHRAESFSGGCQHVERVPEPHEFIQAALNALKTEDGVVEITDSGRNGELPAISAVANQRIELRAADFKRPLLVLEDEAKLPEMLISGEEGSTVTINGLVISNGFLHVTGKLSRLTLRHCTLVPGLSLSIDGKPQHPFRPSLIVESPGTFVEIDHCIVGGLRVVENVHVHITDSIVDATSEHSIAYASPTTSHSAHHAPPGGTLHVENSTIIGIVRTALLELASNTIFLAKPTDEEIAPVYVERRQQGCVRFCYLPAGAKTPRRYHCQSTEGNTKPIDLQFTSLHYGHPGYCQLNQRTAIEIRTGADDKAEMGAFHDLYQPQREANLRTRLDEYLRFGFETGIFYMT